MCELHDVEVRIKCVCSFVLCINAALYMHEILSNGETSLNKGFNFFGASIGYSF